MTEIAVMPKSDLEELIRSTVEAAVSKLKVEYHPPLMNKAQVAAYLRKPKSAVNKYMKEGMPFHKDGKDYPEFYRAEIDRWLEERFGGIQEISWKEGRTEA